MYGATSEVPETVGLRWRGNEAAGVTRPELIASHADADDICFNHIIGHTQSAALFAGERLLVGTWTLGPGVRSQVPDLVRPRPRSSDSGPTSRIDFFVGRV